MRFKRCNVELSGLEEICAADACTCPFRVPDRAAVQAVVEDCERVCRCLGAGIQAEAGPVAKRADEAGFDLIVHGVRDSLGDCIVIEDDDLSEPSFEH